MPGEQKWIDDPRALKALAHPLRVQLLGALRRFGPATSTHLAERFDETTGATSYHLRQLARHGFVEEDPERAATARGRERWWRATAQMTSWNTTDFEGDPQGREADEWLRRNQARLLFSELDRWLARQNDEDKAWRAAAEISDYNMRVSPSTLRALLAELGPVLARYNAMSEQCPDARDVLIGLLAFPRALEVEP